jgi:single-stranded-DNA-specific exonuclease
LKYKLINNEIYNPFSTINVQDIIFKNREVEDKLGFMCPSEQDLLDPFLLDNMQEGIDLLSSHIGDDIFLIVDSDVDGYTSAAIIYNYIKEWFPKVRIKWMVHEDKGHGINLDLIPINTKLVICPDSSSNEQGKHKELNSQGIDILVIDHHDAPFYSKYATVINNQLSNNYNNKFLSGAGVVFKFCQAVDHIRSTYIADKYIDLVALGLIADMMDVRSMENRYIIQEGLKNINNPFFKELIKKQQYSLGNQSINTIGVMFYISPPINAITRVGTLEEKETMFSAFINGDKFVLSDKRGSTEKDRETIAEKAVRYAMNARNRQKKLVDEVKENIEITLEDQDLSDSPLILIKLKDITNRNLTGLVANQLASKYKRPVLLLVDQGDQSFIGSGRNYGYSEIENLKDCLSDTELFDFAEGHQSAFGAKITEENMDTFIEQLKKFFPEDIEPHDVYSVDFIFQAKDFNINHIRDIAKLRTLWGKGFDEPLIAIEQIPIDGDNLSIMGKNQSHIKFIHNDISYVMFHLSSEEIEKFKNKKLIINIIGRCDVNIWQNNFTYQVIVQNYQIIDEESEFAF